MTPLIKPFQEAVDNIRESLKDPHLTEPIIREYCNILMVVIDEATKRKYTEDQLRFMFENPRIKAMGKFIEVPKMPRNQDGTYVFDDSNVAWYWFRQAARDLGLYEGK